MKNKIFIHHVLNLKDYLFHRNKYYSDIILYIVQLWIK